jgi:anti-sigma B factor antagonist
VTIDEERRGKIAILTLRGSYAGRPGATMFERAIYDLLKNDIVCIVLNLAGLKAIDSAGLGAMISAMVSVGRREGALKLAAPGKEVHRVLKNMHLDQVFELFNSVDEAEASFVKKGRHRAIGDPETR